MTDHRPIPAVLNRLIDASQKRVAVLQQERVERTIARLAGSHPHRPFREALEQVSPAIIAEVKMASPSKGVFRKDLEPALQATSYARGGCAAISVVTEPEYFLGSGEWVARIREQVDVPILRKDFIIDPVQILESAAIGADAILLIARVLTVEQLAEFSRLAYANGLEVLFEVHDEPDIAKISGLSPQLIGVNARDLDTFTVDRQRLVGLKKLLPAGALPVAESGIESHTDIAELQRAGYGAFLVGETLMRSDDPAATLRALRGEK